MKKKIRIIAFLTFLLMFALCTCAFALQPSVVDEAGYLSADELSDIMVRLDHLRNKYNMDVSVYIESNMSGSDAESTADDLFDYNGYGIGSSKDGIILYLSQNPRKYHYSTHGYGETAFNDRGLEYLDNRVLPYLEEDDYYMAFITYAQTADEMLHMAADGEPYNEKDGMAVLIAIAAIIFGPIIISAIMTGSKQKQMNTAVKQDYADSYMKPGSLNVSTANDIFLYRVVNRTEKPKSESGGHYSSSGEHHGGRGGSY